MRSRCAVFLPFVISFLLSSTPTVRVPLLLVLAQQSLSLVSATLVNITIDDTSSLIAYSPSTSWRSSTTPCPTCLAPSVQLAYAGTWHDGTHIIPTADADDDGSTDVDSDDPPKSTGTSSTAHATQTSKQGDSDDDDSDGDGDNKSTGSTAKGRRRRWIPRNEDLTARNDSDDNPFFTDKLDSDDPGFVDTPVTAQFNFTGSAVYVFALVPLFAAAPNNTPTFMNVTATLDNQQAGTFLHTGSTTSGNTSTSYEPSALIFTKTGMTEGPHNLTLSAGPDSVLLLDYIVYSQQDSIDGGGQETGGVNSSSTAVTHSSTAASTSSAPLSAILSQSTSTTTMSPKSKSHNIATFAGAVGGSVGLLSLLALSLAFSIYRRRLLARRRDRAYRETQRDAASISESFHTDASDDGPPMQGPAPFVPRYFPGTVINTAPPPYSPPAPPSSSPSSALLGSPDTPLPSIAYSSRRFGIILDGDTSYADRPPPTPPLDGADIEDGYFAPPPPFPVAISTPVPAILAGLNALLSPPQSPEPRPVSPVVPLLAPPPSSRPHSLHDEIPVAGPSGTQGEPASTVPSSGVSLHSIQVSPSYPSLHRQPSNASTQASIHDSSSSSMLPSATATSENLQRLGEMSSRDQEDVPSTHL